MNNHPRPLEAVSNKNVPPITDGTLGLLEEISRQRRRGKLSDEQLLAITEGRDPFSLKWYDVIVRRCQSQLTSVLKRPIVVPPPPALITPELVEKLSQFNMIPVYFPELDIDIKFTVEKGQWIKLNDLFYNNLGPGVNDSPRIDLAATKIKAGWYSIDLTMTPSADYDDIQIYPNDPLFPLIYRLRQEKKIYGFHKPTGSRFSLTSEEWETIVAPALANEIGLKQAQAVTRLEKAIEFNLICNVYDKDRITTNVWQWFADLYGPIGRLNGGDSGSGGPSHINFHNRNDRNEYISGRCLVEFLPESVNSVS